MARIRTIKPEFFTSEDIVGLTPLARLLYIAMWCECDKEGRMVWKPFTMKLRYFPADDCNINELCQEIIDSKLVFLFGEGYAFIPSFKAHQHINPRETASQLPNPSESGMEKPRVGTRHPRVGTDAATDSDVQGGREGKGREGLVSKDTLSTEDPIDVIPTEIPNCPHQVLMDLFGKHLPVLPQPKPELWEGAKAEAMRARWKWVLTAKRKSGDRYATTKDEAIAWFDRFFAYAAESDFLTGRSGKWTSCDLPWLMKAENFSKVISGNYENK